MLREEDEEGENDSKICKDHINSSNHNASASQDIDPLLEGSRISSEFKRVSIIKKKEDEMNKTWEDKEQQLLSMDMSSDEENLKKLTEKANKSMLNFTKYMEGEEAKINQKSIMQSQNLGKPKKIRPAPVVTAKKGSGAANK